ncbi:MAG: efflux RND transporter periplasmic adaptor subunit [Bacteroidales bacterium]
MKATYLITILTSFIVLTSCNGTKDNVEQKSDESPIVTVVQSKTKTYSPTLTYSGTVFANRESNLGAALPGKVEKIFYQEGEQVNEGDLIVELSDEMLTQAEVENQALKKDYERVKRLREKESVSQMEYDHIKAKLDASNAKTEMVRKNTRVYAPFSGTIVDRMMEEGEIYFLNPGLEPGYSMRSGIVRLMQLNPVRIKFEVNEKDLAHIKKGLQVEVALDAFPYKKFTAEISSIKHMLSTTTRTAPVEIELPSPSGEIKPGMFAKIIVTLPKQEGVFVPLNCISRVPGTAEDFVFVVDNDTARRVTVSRTYTNGDMVAVTGIKPNEQIIAEGKSRVSNGQKVDVR